MVDFRREAAPLDTQEPVYISQARAEATELMNSLADVFDAAGRPPTHEYTMPGELGTKFWPLAHFIGKRELHAPGVFTATYTGKIHSFLGMARPRRNELPYIFWSEALADESVRVVNRRYPEPTTVLPHFLARWDGELQRLGMHPAEAERLVLQEGSAEPAHIYNSVAMVGLLKASRERILNPAAAKPQQCFDDARPYCPIRRLEA